MKRKTKVQDTGIAPYCPGCRTTKDARFVVEEATGKRVAIHCIACGTSPSCCPKCLAMARRADNQLALKCHSCPGTFPDPKIKDDEWGITPDEMQFLLNVGERLSSHISKLRSLDHYEEHLARVISDTRYIDGELKRFIVIPRLLKWRRRVFSAKAVPGKAVPLDINYIEKKLLTENVHYKPSERARSKTAGILKEIFTTLTALEIHTEDCCSLTFCGQHYDGLSSPQGDAIKFFIEEAKAGRPDVQIGPKRGKKIHTAMGIDDNSRVKDSFTNHPLWDYLIISREWGVRRLAVYPDKFKIPTS